MEADEAIDAEVQRLDLLCWLVELGATDRDQYRLIREAMWSMYAANAQSRSPRSDIPSNSS
jgi:hypothetical protein